MKAIRALAFFLATTLAVAQNSTPATAYALSDLEGLDQALKKEPENIGLRLRVVRRLLDDWRTSADPKAQDAMIQRIEAELAEVRRQGPSYAYPLRVQALQHYRKGEWENFLSLAREHQKIAPLDFEMRTFYVKALMRIATDEKNPQPERKKEAAEYVGNWFDGGEAPAFGTTVGTCAAWLLDEGFRAELLAIFEDRYRRDPKNINLVISYAACLANLGRNEKAWDLVHAAEPWGLADEQTGGRHPIVRLLQWACPEAPSETAYDGSELEKLQDLAKKYPQDASLSFRLASNLKLKGLAAEKVVELIDARLAAYQRGELNEQLTTPEKKKEFEDKARSQRQEWSAKSQDFYSRAIDPALNAWNINPTIETVSLLLGECYAKIGRNDESIKHLKAAIEKVPFYTALRERLAEVYRSEKRWKDLATEMVEVCRVTVVRADIWDHEVKGSILPVPKTDRELLLRDLLEDKDSRAALISTFEEAAAADAKNPNLKAFLAMMEYFIGDKAKASSWMLAAEKLGMCGEAGRAHPLATEIFSRQAW